MTRGTSRARLARTEWTHRLRSGETLWESLRRHYDMGVDFVGLMRDTWQGLKGRIDPQRHVHVSGRLEQQMENALLWRKVCLDYFSRFL